MGKSSGAVKLLTGWRKSPSWGEISPPVANISKVCTFEHLHLYLSRKINFNEEFRLYFFQSRLKYNFKDERTNEGSRGDAS